MKYRLIAIAKGVLSAACLNIAIAVAASKPTPTPAELAPTHGYVYVNLPKPGFAPIELTVQRKGDKKPIRLSARSDPGLEAYGAWVPAGEYSFAKWYEWPWGAHEPFIVEAGKVTDLGSLIPVEIGGYEFVPLPLRPAETAGRVRDAVAEFQSLVSPDVIEWSPASLPGAMRMHVETTLGKGYEGLGISLLQDYDLHRNKPPLRKQLRETRDKSVFFNLAKSAMPPLYDEGIVDSASNLYFGADLGQVRVRSAGGEWSSLDTGTIRRVTALFLQDTTLWVGTQHVILRSTGDRSHWEQLAAVDPSEWITGIHKVQSGWLLATVRPTGRYAIVDNVKLYTAKKEDLSDLTLLREAPVEDKAVGILYPGPEARISHGYYFANLLKEFIRVKLDTMEMQVITPPRSATSFNISSSGTITAYLNRGMFSKLFVSVDDGTTWIERPAPPFVIEDIHFADAETGHEVRSSPGLIVDVLLDVRTYDATKKKWPQLLEAPEGCIRMLHDAAQDPRFCVTKGNSILVNTGKTWAVEFALR